MSNLVQHYQTFRVVSLVYVTSLRNSSMYTNRIDAAAFQMPLVTKEKNVCPNQPQAHALHPPTWKSPPRNISITEARHPAHPPQKAPYPVLLRWFHGSPEGCCGGGRWSLCCLDDVSDASDRLVDAILSGLGRVDLEIRALPLLSHSPALLSHRSQLCLSVLVESCW